MIKWIIKWFKGRYFGGWNKRLELEIHVLQAKLKEEQQEHEKTKSQLKVYKYIVTTMPETLDEIKISRGLKKRILNKLQSMIIIK